jgi:hypothetical protein
MTTGRTQLPEPNWSFEIPDKLKLAVADCILLYSKIESCIVELVWLIEGADLARKREIAKGWGDQNFRIVKKVVTFRYALIISGDASAWSVAWIM